MIKLEQENNVLQDVIDELKSKIEGLEYELTSRENEIEKLEEENNGIRDELDNVNHEKDEAYMEIQSLERTVASQREELENFIGYQG